MNNDENLFRLALSKVGGIGPIRYKKLVEHFGSAKEVFSKSIRQLKSVYGISQSNSIAIKSFSDFNSIEKEILFAEKNNILILGLNDEAYPHRLRQCIDSPSFLFYKGSASLNHPRIISIIGTRSFTDYGRRACEEIIEGLKTYDVMVTSGLAFGIDAIAHKACLKHHLPTVGVVAHGLDSIYPIEHIGLSREMQTNGGVLSEYFSGTKPDKGNFPTRNRIVAGMADATLIIETDLKGGSIITGEIAYSYNRDLLCVPGRISDSKSNGCNFLIKSLKGQMVTCADDIANCMGWGLPKIAKPLQRQLFIELNEDEEVIVSLLKQHEKLHIDEFYTKSFLNSSELASSLLSLEMQNIIQIMPGKIVSLVN